MSLASKLRGLHQVLAFDNGVHLLLQRTLFRREPLAVYRMGSLEFVVDHSAGDASGVPDVLTRPMYADHLEHLTPRHAVNLLDLGANAGGFPLFLALHGVRFDRVVSVELNPRTCVRLRFNLERNLRGDIHVLNAALCGSARPFDLALGEGSVADSLYAPSFNATDRITHVEGLTFDTIFDRYFRGRAVDICKIDVECAEYEVMAHPGHDRLACCRVLVVEVHDIEGKSHSEVIDPICDLGFDLLPQGSDRSVYVFRNRGLAAGAFEVTLSARG
jgi:FkbM family methyltransferase